MNINYDSLLLRNDSLLKLNEFWPSDEIEVAIYPGLSSQSVDNRLMHMKVGLNWCNERIYSKQSRPLPS